MSVSERALKLLPVGGVVRYAHMFYELLGNRRRFERVPTSGNIFATFRGRAMDFRHECVCVDLSPRGIAIDCPEPMQVDSILHLHTTELGPRRLARVRYCRKRGESYRLGLEFVAE